MTKRKEYDAILNKIVNTDKVISRGQRIPVLELTFKPDGYQKNGHLVYIDYKCAKELIEKLDKQVREIEASYYPYEIYNRINNKVHEGLKNQEGQP
jgi:hypothetical protein